MIAEELINHMIPPLKLRDTIGHAKLWMEELRCSQLPVVKKGVFLGLLTEEMIQEANNAKKLISDLDPQYASCFVKLDQHFYDIIRTAADNKVELVGVLDANNNYAGVITVQDTIAAFAETMAVQSPGGILVLSISSIDYSLAEVSRLIESEGSRVLASSVKDDPNDSGKLKLTLKLDRDELNNIVATLERFSYRVIARFEEKDYKEDDKERIDILLKYLDI